MGWTIRFPKAYVRPAYQTVGNRSNRGGNLPYILCAAISVEDRDKILTHTVVSYVPRVVL